MTDLDAERVVAVLAGRPFVEVHLRRRFQCSACGKSWSSKQRAVRHVKACSKDPAARACATCRHDLRAMCSDEVGCDIDARPFGEQIVFGCPSWEGQRR